MTQQLQGQPAAGSWSPWAQPQAWDSINIAGVFYGYGLIPQGGVVRVQRACRHFRIDKKDISGGDGSKSTNRGIQPKEFDIILRCWTSDQYDYIQNVFVPAILNRQKGGALTVVHPKLLLFQITAIMLEQIDFDHVGQEGDKDYELKLAVYEFRPAPAVNVTSSPAGASANSGTTQNKGRQPSAAAVASANALAAQRQRVADAKALRDKLYGSL